MKKAAEEVPLSWRKLAEDFHIPEEEILAEAHRIANSRTMGVGMQISKYRFYFHRPLLRDWESDELVFQWPRFNFCRYTGLSKSGQKWLYRWWLDIFYFAIVRMAE